MGYIKKKRGQIMKRIYKDDIGRVPEYIRNGQTVDKPLMVSFILGITDPIEEEADEYPDSFEDFISMENIHKKK